MAKAPPPRPAEDQPRTLADEQSDVALAPTQPGPDEAPPQVPTSDPAAFELPKPQALSKGQVTGLCSEGIEAYLFGQRTRYDANGRLWNMRREAVNGFWSLAITVSLGGLRLGEGAIPLDRLPSADGEHQLIALIEALAAQVDRAHHDAWAEQRKQAAGRDEPA